MNETETEIGWRVARGELASPQLLPGFAIFSLRFSGTGTAWREIHQEHVFRPPEQYLSAEMISRIAGVPVVTVHPEAGNLDSGSFAETVVGAICFGYIADSSGIQSADGDELWCIARIGDATAAAAMATGEFSTSPCVVFGPNSGNEKMQLQDGTSILLEGRPLIIDHLAACISAGVWDKAGAGGLGIRTDSTKGTTEMTDEEMADKARKDAEAEKERKDAESASGMGKVMECLDSISKRLDAIEKRGDKTRKDGEATEETPAEKRTREEREALERVDTTRRDSAFTSSAAAKARREMENANISIQADSDPVFRAWGNAAPPPMAGEPTVGYRVRLLRHHQVHCKEDSFKGIDLSALAATHPDALAGIERKIYADSLAASSDPTNGPEDYLHAITRTTDSGHRITEFRGKRTFITALKRPSLRATAFLTPQHLAGRG